MNARRILKWYAAAATAIVMVAFASTDASAHCDTMNGPVIKAAKQALETGDVNLVLIWVQRNDEAAIKEAFQRTLDVRKLGADARRLADMYFFETLVRIHRAGEGVAYTGIKPEGTEVEPGIAAADKALEAGSIDETIRHLDEAIHQGVKAKYEEVAAKKRFAPADVEAGRQYVRSYVEFIHYVERLFQAASNPAEGHFHEGSGPAVEHEGN